MYNAIIGSQVESINLLAIPQIEGASVEVLGADNIQFGDNTIIIKVTAKDGVTIKEYTIALYKTTIEEENQNIMLINEEENRAEEAIDNKVTAGQTIFVIIIGGSTAGAIYMLIRKYRMER